MATDMTPYTTSYEVRVFRSEPGAESGIWVKFDKYTYGEDQLDRARDVEKHAKKFYKNVKVLETKAI